MLLRGVNHAQLSNGALREGDLEPEQDAAGATAAAAAVLGDFVAAHLSPERCSPARAAVPLMCCWLSTRTADTLLMYALTTRQSTHQWIMAPAIWTLEGDAAEATVH